MEQRICTVEDSIGSLRDQIVQASQDAQQAMHSTTAMQHALQLGLQHVMQHLDADPAAGRPANRHESTAQRRPAAPAAQPASKRARQATHKKPAAPTPSVANPACMDQRGNAAVAVWATDEARATESGELANGTLELETNTPTPVPVSVQPVLQRAQSMTTSAGSLIPEAYATGATHRGGPGSGPNGHASQVAPLLQQLLAGLKEHGAVQTGQAMAAALREQHVDTGQFVRGVCINLACTAQWQPCMSWVFLATLTMAPLTAHIDHGGVDHSTPTQLWMMCCGR